MLDAKKSLNVNSDKIYTSINTYDKLESLVDNQNLELEKTNTELSAVKDRTLKLGELYKESESRHTEFYIQVYENFKLLSKISHDADIDILHLLGDVEEKLNKKISKLKKKLLIISILCGILTISQILILILFRGL